MLVELGQSSFSFFCFVDQPNLRLKLAAALGKTVLKLGNPNSTSIVVTLLNENKKKYSHIMAYNRRRFTAGDAAAGAMVSATSTAAADVDVHFSVNVHQCQPRQSGRPASH